MLKSADIYQASPLVRLDDIGGISFNPPDYAAAAIQDAATGRALQLQKQRRELRQLFRDVRETPVTPLTRFHHPVDLARSPRFSRQDTDVSEAAPIGSPLPGYTPPTEDPAVPSGGPSSELLPPFDLPDGSPGPSEAPPLLDVPAPDGDILDPLEDEEPLEPPADLNKIGVLFNPRRLYRSFLT